jgi:hypothetical protein
MNKLDYHMELMDWKLYYSHWKPPHIGGSHYNSGWVPLHGMSREQAIKKDLHFAFQNAVFLFLRLGLCNFVKAFTIPNSNGIQ